MKQGTGYLGSSSIKTSVANAEIIPEAPLGWSFGYELIKLDIVNDQDCTFIINGSTELFSRKGEGFSMGIGDPTVKSLKIKENGIQYNWRGVY